MKINSYTGGILLIAGTCIGAGMLALPITLASSGFWLSSVWLILCWVATCLTGLYVLEANLGLQEKSNFVSMAKSTLGRWGEIVAWITYLLLLYSLMAAYLSAGGDIIAKGLHTITKIHMQDWLDPLPWVVIVALVVYLGARFVDGLNRILMTGLIISYIVMVLDAIPDINMSLINTGEVGYLLPALPILATSFGYHVIIPSIRTYMHSDVNHLPRVIIFGSLLPLVIYIAWNAVVFGTIPTEGSHGLLAIYQSGHPASELTNTMSITLDHPALVTITEFFIFFTIASSFLGISFAFFDFLRDGFKVHHVRFGKPLVVLFAFVPPFLYTTFFPQGFMLALSYAGIFVAILHGFLPALMVWSARKNKMTGSYRAPGGHVGLVVILLLSLLVIISTLPVLTF